MEWLLISSNQDYQYPFTSLTSCLTGIVTYLSVISGLQWIMDRHKLNLDLQLKKWVTVHNAFLAVASLVLLWMILSELVRLALAEHSSWWNVLCDPKGEFTSGHIYFLYYINYLFKWFELLDTVYLCLRRKKIIVLHWYHHAATVLLCYVQLSTQSCMQWVPITINLFVHVFLYMYYAMYEMGIQCWWKKYLTNLQIVQFIIGLLMCFGVFGIRILHDYWRPDFFDHCHGTYFGGFFGIAILLSYLVLFVQLHRNLYTTNAKTTKTTKTG